MNDSELKKLWQSSQLTEENNGTGEKIEDIEISNLKVKKLISSMKPIKIFTLAAGILWVIMGLYLLGNIYLNDFEGANKFFLYSATFQVLLTAISVVIYLYQLILINKVDLSEPVIATQEKLSKLKSTTLTVTRILFLQLPVWTTFWWNNLMFEEWGVMQLSVVFLITILFTAISLWIFINLKFENRDKKWFKLILAGKEWTPLINSLNILEQIEEVKND
ncbi:MAG: hypothetical protein IAE91_00165 [Ignavibacteriaceae bacterium]|nr:hypothetical protein [Ignavibacteriaceae bacterium]